MINYEYMKFQPKPSSRFAVGTVFVNCGKLCHQTVRCDSTATGLALVITTEIGPEDIPMDLHNYSLAHLEVFEIATPVLVLFCFVRLYLALCPEGIRRHLAQVVPLYPSVVGVIVLSKAHYGVQVCLCRVRALPTFPHDNCSVGRRPHSLRYRHNCTQDTRSMPLPWTTNVDSRVQES
eukprot:sb/3471812/